MTDAAIRAARMMNSQAAMLRRRMEVSKPQAEEQGGMLFKRTVQMPPNVDLGALLHKWNPGVPDEAMADLVTTVCRWNQLKTPEAIRPGQQLLIPTVIPHGQEPRDPLKAPMGTALRAAPTAARSTTMALSSVVEQRARTGQANAAGAQTIWATGNQAGQNLAGAAVKQQFQAGAWARRV